MPSLLLLVFLVELAVQLINLIGAETLGNTLWNLYNLVPSKRSAAFAEQKKLQLEYLEVRRALTATSSQDEFAKWARLRRKHDKMLEQLEAKKNSLAADRRAFDWSVSIGRFVLTRAPQYVLPFWYARQPMFWLPHGLFPYYAEWLLSFPRAPLGSVSITSWQLSCAAVLVMLREVVEALVALVGSWQSKTASSSSSSNNNNNNSQARTKTPVAAKTE